MTYDGLFAKGSPLANDLEYLRHSMRHFVGFSEDASALYRSLASHVADDDDILLLARTGQKRQPPVNLLFGSVHYLLLAGAEHELSRYYPSVGGTEPAEEAFPAFQSFCAQYRDEIIELIESRRVQTNEVGRCGLLLPGFVFAQNQFVGHPFHLIDVGASAGLNLCFDRYRYEYSTGLICGRAESPARIRTEILEGAELFPLSGSAMPAISSRIGIDIAPVDVLDDDGIRWVEALIWPDMMDRIELFRAAVEIARRNPPRIVEGSAFDVLPDVITQSPAGAVPCVFHSHAIYQMSKEKRAEFMTLIADLSRERDLAHVSLEWLGDDPRPKLHFTAYRAGQQATPIHLADCHHHGRTMRWIAPEEG